MSSKVATSSRKLRAFLIWRFLAFFALLVWGILVYNWTKEDPRGITPVWYFLLFMAAGIAPYPGLRRYKFTNRGKFVSILAKLHFMGLLAALFYSMAIRSHLLIFAVFLGQMAISFVGLIYLQTTASEGLIEATQADDLHLLFQINACEVPSAVKILNGWGIPEKLKEIFTHNGYALSSTARVDKVMVDREWVLTDRARTDFPRTFTLSLEGDKLSVYAPTMPLGGLRTLLAIENGLEKLKSLLGKLIHLGFRILKGRE